MKKRTDPKTNSFNINKSLRAWHDWKIGLSEFET